MEEEARELLGPGYTRDYYKQHIAGFVAIAVGYCQRPELDSILHHKNPKYSREGKRLLILHNQDCDQFGDITGESPEYLWFTRHGGYFKMEKATGEVETLKPAEF